MKIQPKRKPEMNERFYEGNQKMDGGGRETFIDIHI